MRLRAAMYTGLLAATVALSHCPKSLEQKVEITDHAAIAESAPQSDLVNSIVAQYELPLHVHQYLVNHVDDALALEQQWRIPAAAALAKAGAEHGFNQEQELIANAQNHFGLKCREQFKDTYPDCYKKVTWEFERGRKRFRTDSFVKYVTARDSYLHFGEFLATRRIGNRKPYAAVMRSTNTPEEFLTALAKSSYSTDPNELKTTMWMLRQYRLKEIVADVKRAR